MVDAIFFSNSTAISRGGGCQNALTGWGSTRCSFGSVWVMRTTLCGQADTRFAVNCPLATNFGGWCKRKAREDDVICPAGTPGPEGGDV